MNHDYTKELKSLKEDILDRSVAEKLGKKMPFSEQLVYELCEKIKDSEFEITAAYIYAFIVSYRTFMRKKKNGEAKDDTIKKARSLLISYISEHEIFNSKELFILYSYYAMLIYSSLEKEEVFDPSFIETIVTKRIKKQSNPVRGRVLLFYLEYITFSVALIKLLTSFQKERCDEIREINSVPRICFWKLCQKLSLLRKEIWSSEETSQNSRQEILEKLRCEKFFIKNLFNMKSYSSYFYEGFDLGKELIKRKIWKENPSDSEELDEYFFNSDESEDDLDFSSKQEKEYHEAFAKYKEEDLDLPEEFSECYFPYKILDSLKSDILTNGYHSAFTYYLFARSNYLYKDLKPILDYLSKEKSLIVLALDYTFKESENPEGKKMHSYILALSRGSEIGNYLYPPHFGNLFIPIRDIIFFLSKKKYNVFEYEKSYNTLENQSFFREELFLGYSKLVEEYRKKHSIGEGIPYFDKLTIWKQGDFMIHHDSVVNRRKKKLMMEHIKKWLFTSSNKVFDIKNENLWRVFLFFGRNVEENLEKKKKIKFFIQEASFLTLPKKYRKIFGKKVFSTENEIYYAAMWIVENIIDFPQRRSLVLFLKEKMIEYLEKRGGFSEKEKIHLFCVRVILSIFKDEKITAYMRTLLNDDELSDLNKNEKEIYNELLEESTFKADLGHMGRSSWSDDFYDFLLDIFHEFEQS